jgi:undecaprenyl diphosphate synthase
MSAVSTVVPRHVAIIMDGNGRWATQQGHKRTAGHQAGIDSVEAVIDAAREAGIEILTLFAFSTENWKRPKLETAFLMRMLKKFLVNKRPEMIRKGIKLSTIGDLTVLPKAVQKELETSQQATATNSGMRLVLALNYGSRQEIAAAVAGLARRVAAGKLSADEICPQLISSVLDTADYCDPDLIIRTAGEQRLSNFLLWQASYSELWFTPVFWPEFKPGHFKEALQSYAGRQRRFGGLSGSAEGQQ